MSNWHGLLRQILATAHALGLMVPSIEATSLRMLTIAGCGLLTAYMALGATIRVGPQRAIHTIAEAAIHVEDGDTVEVDAGDYLGDVATWRRNKLTLRAVGGRVRLVANGASSDDKGIWVIRGKDVVVDGFDFIGATVTDKNGAGIRFENGSLTVRNCTFMHNENGILSSNIASMELTIENSEFGFNGYGDGRSHNLYAGSIAKLSVTGSYFHHAKVGHLLKSRAAVNFIQYNRLTDETGGTASYELEFPNGGVAYVIGNIIAQSPTTENPHMVSFGAEGYTASVNELYLVNNTLIDELPHGGIFLRVRSGASAVRIVNNLFVGNPGIPQIAQAYLAQNFSVNGDVFVDPQQGDFRLKNGASFSGHALEPGAANGQNLNPIRQYSHPRNTVPVTSFPFLPGAIQNTGMRFGVAESPTSSGKRR